MKDCLRILAQAARGSSIPPRAGAAAAAFMAAFAFSGAAAGDDPTGTAKAKVFCEANPANGALYREMHHMLFMERDVTKVEDYYHAEFYSHNMDNGESGRRVVTADFMKEMWTKSRKQDPSRRLDADLVLCADDYVIARTTMTGARQLPGADGEIVEKTYTMTATDIYRFENGKVAERWGNFDGIDLMTQLGYTIVPPGGTGAPNAE